MAGHNFLRQFSLETTFDPSTPQTEHLDKAVYSKEIREFRESLLNSSSNWPRELDTVASPLPALIPEHLQESLDQLGDILARAVTNIVERWWSDEESKFWERMPILEHQEAVLRWIEGTGNGLVEAFSRRKGVWRPDFLLNFPGKQFPEKKLSGAIQICEINARFAFNGFWITAFAHEAYAKKFQNNPNLKSPVNPEKIFAAYEGLIDVNKPIHLLKGEEAGLDIHLFVAYIQNRLGLQIRFILPTELRLVPNSQAGSGNTLCCVVNPSDLATESEDFRNWRLISKDGEILEQIFQVGLELHQREMENLGIEMLKALAPICFNDLRTIYLVHDKRMLGILLQELDSLVAKQQVLSAEEAEILRDGIVPTINAGSDEMKSLLQLSKAGLVNKENYILKPIGSGKGKGILFGSDMPNNEWIDSIRRLSNRHKFEGQNYVIQRSVVQPQFKVVIPDGDSRSGEMQHFFVGTFMMINGEQLGIGCWRSSKEKICAVSRGGTWMCSLMLDESKQAPNSISKPNVPRIAVPSLTHSRDLAIVKQIHETLQKHGILLLDLKFSDPESNYLLDLTHSLTKYHSHNPPLFHSGTCGYFWDVKPTPASVSIPFHARSQTTNDFPWHTDCSYASEPPRFFGLHVLQADRCGGGTLSVLQLSKVLHKLGKEAVIALCSNEYEIKVPPEFANGIDLIVGSVLSKTALEFFENNTAMKTIESEPRIRFRADILNPLTERAGKALKKLNVLLAEARGEGSDVCLHLDPSVIPNGTIVLLDNGRWLHARNQVKDTGRHLRRIRWDAREF